MDRLTTWARAHPWGVIGVIALVTAVLFSAGVDQPAKLNFDETHYVPAARALLAGEAHLNREHPLVGKIGVAAGIAVLGDRPIGWRAGSVVMGVVALIGVFWIAYYVVGGVGAGAFAATLALLNQMLFIQSRIAMLDIYMAGFFLAALALYCRAAFGAAARRDLALSAVCLGLAIGAKWAVIPYAAAMGLALAGAKMHGWLVSGGAVSHRLGGVVGGMLFTRMGPWRGVSMVEAGVILTGVSVATYFATYIPLVFVAGAAGPGEWIDLQFFMLGQQSQTLAPHTYQSDWPSWPAMVRPIWYFYEQIDGVQRGVLFIGNLVVHWGGLIALLYALIFGALRRSRALLIPAGMFLIAYLSYAVLPKKIGFFYYYFLPAMTLPIVIAAAVDHWGANIRRTAAIGAVRGGILAASALCFLYFYPIVAARPLENDQAFLNWAWFRSWR